VSRRLRVLILTPDFAPAHGGIQVLMHRLVSHWQEEMETLVLAPRAFPRRRRGELLRLNLEAIARAQRYRPDLVLNAHIVLSPAARAIRRTIGAPYVQYVYGMEICDRPRLARSAVRSAAATIVISAYSAALVKGWVKDSALHLVYPGVDRLRNSGARSRRPIIVTVSRLAERYKGHDVMLRALPLVRARVPDAQWLVVGDGPLRPVYERMARVFGVSEMVRFVGDVDDEERDRWLDQAHVFAMPSRLSPNGGGEGFGIVYLEAGAHRLPVIAGNVGGALDAVVDGVTGLLVDPTDHVAVAGALIELLLDRSRAAALGDAGATRAHEFAWESVAKRVQCVLREVADARAA
jgi:phosphatidyl-myo-inositol dimannoside synthase